MKFIKEMIESVKNAFINCLKFKGRTNRKDFWYYVLFFAIMLLILYFPALKIAKELRHGSYFFISPLLLAMPFFSLICRRLNDAGKTKWWLKVLAFFCLYFLLVFIVMIFHHPDLEFERLCNDEWCDREGSMDTDTEANPYLTAFFLPLIALFAISKTLGILGLILFILMFILILPYIFITLLEDPFRQRIYEDEDVAKNNEDTTEKDEEVTEKDKKLGTAGKVFLCVVTVLVIGIPVLEIIRLTSAA